MPDRDVIARLRSIISSVESRPAPVRRAASGDDSWLASTVSSLGLEIRQTASGPVLLREDEYPGFHMYGDCRLDDSRADSDTYRVLAQDENHRDFHCEDALFLDTETTGLSGGTGTHVFLVGLGEFTSDSFKVIQYLMPDPSFEPAMLRLLAEVLASKSWLVTFNGRSFDVPLLETRFTFQRLRTPFAQHGHFDLLHAARRLWKDSFQCNLSSLEEHVLRHTRSDDIPSALIPGLFFDFLRSREPALLKPVLEHNRDDVLAMAALLGRMCHIVESPEALGPSRGPEFLNIGRLFERAKMVERSLEIYRNAPGLASSESVRLRALNELARAEKHQRNFDEAAVIWEQISGEDPYALAAHLELAKHYEHRNRDYQRALSMCDRALESLHVITRLANEGSNDRRFAEVEKRKQRLVKKTQRQPERDT